MKSIRSLGSGGAARIVLGVLAGIVLLWGAEARATTLFALVDTGELFASSNQGVTWAIRASLPVRDAVGLGAGASASQLFLASASGLVYRSDDAGVNWTAVGTVAASDVVDLVVRPDLSLLLLTSTGTVYRSSDLGVTFSAVGALSGSNYVSLARNGTASRLYALDRTGEISKSSDGGGSWNAVGAIALPDAVKLRVVQGRLYALGGSGELYLSTDSAATWIAKGTLSQVGMTSLTNDAGTLIVASGAGEVATSPDGAAWTWRGTINQLILRSLGVDTPAAASVGSPGGALAFSMTAPGPNPVARGRAVSFEIRVSQHEDVSFELYDVAGRRVAEHAAGAFSAGGHAVSWDLGARVAGLYYLRIRAGGEVSAARRIVVVS